MFWQEWQTLLPHIEDDLRMQQIFEHVTEDCQCEGKQCSKCEEVECVGLFDVRREVRGKKEYVYLRTYCQICRKNQQKARWHNDSEAINARRRAQRPERADALRATLKANWAINRDKYNERRRTKRASDGVYAERVRANNRAYRLRHAEERRLYLKVYRQNNIDRLRAYDRHRYREDDLRRQSSKIFRQKHPERMKALDGIYHHERRSRKKAAPGNYTAQQIQEQLKRQHYRCYYLRCGRAKFLRDKSTAYGYQFHIEHIIPLSRTEHNPRNDMSNIVLACGSCNTSKRDKLPHEWPEGGRLF